MPGLNHVEPGGEPLTLALPGGATVTKTSVGPMDNNAYLLRSGNAALLVDAAAEEDRLLALTGGTLGAVLTTHRHGDHWQALAPVAEATGATLYCGRPDVDAIATGAWVEGLVGLWDGDVVQVGALELEVIGLVGHTPGSIALLYEDPNGHPHLWTGDSLFPGGVGNTRGNKENFTSLIDDVERKLFDRLPDSTWFYPGHGKDSTLGAERPHLAAWRERGW